ncbi:hypothetical protein BDN72DRAFT_918946, partial [Pluteus cervinus]
MGENKSAGLAFWKVQAITNPHLFLSTSTVTEDIGATPYGTNNTITTTTTTERTKTSPRHLSASSKNQTTTTYAVQTRTPVDLGVAGVFMGRDGMTTPQQHDHFKNPPPPITAVQRRLGFKLEAQRRVSLGRLDDLKSPSKMGRTNHLPNPNVFINDVGSMEAFNTSPLPRT